MTKIKSTKASKATKVTAAKKTASKKTAAKKPTAAQKEKAEHEDLAIGDSVVPTPKGDDAKKERKARSERMADKMLNLSASVTRIQVGLTKNKRWGKALTAAKSTESAVAVEKDLSDAMAALVRASAGMRKLEYVFRRTHSFAEGDLVQVSEGSLSRYVDGDIITAEMMTSLSVLKVKGRNVFVETATADGAPVRLLVPRSQLLPAATGKK